MPVSGHDWAVTLSAKERIVRASRSQEVDHIATLGGWMNGVANLANLAGITVEEYLRDPLLGVVRANLALGVDGMVSPSVPTDVDAIRGGLVEESRFEGIEPEALLELADSLPDSEREVSRGFDPAAEEASFRSYFDSARTKWGGLEPIPNFWDLGGHFPLYTQFGYIAFLGACALYPEAVHKIWWAKSVWSRERAKILARLYRELNLVPLLFCGEDLCTNQGPMVSPEFLRAYYFPTVKMILEPIVNAGVRVVHHCDGDVRPVVDEFLAAGFSGFQGFQYECGPDIRDLRSKRSALGEVPIFFAGMSVSRTLPHGHTEDVREEIDYFYDATDGGQGLFLFTSNVTGVEVPPENLRAGYAYAQSVHYPAVDRGHRVWPGTSRFATIS